MSTIPKVIDRREVWLDAVSIDAADMLARLQNRKLNGVTLSDREEDLCEITTGYLYLLKLCKEYGMFDSDDPFNLFEKETLH
tara:strand:+ start:1283 stop:1528 length:246 start_codon:yes stop_codon:yes gene_type:complete